MAYPNQLANGRGNLPDATQLMANFNAALQKAGDTMTGVLLVTDGSVSAPGLAFGSETNSGPYRIGTGNVGMAIQGVQIYRFNSNGIIIQTGNLIFQSTSTQGIQGTTTNDNAAAGNVGEVVRAAVSSVTNFAATNVYADLASISLTAGDWDISVGIAAFGNGTTTFTQWRMGIGTVSGNNTTGFVEGDSWMINPASLAADNSMAIAGYRASITSTTTYYLKYYGAYTGTAPQAVGRISARRMR